jgi:uncharacterized membrane protein (Fun14 family)
MDSSALATKVSIGSLFGVCAGVAVKRLTRDAAYGVGLGFIVLQALSYYGYITINWGKVTDDIQKAADQDGDGKFDATDVKIIVKRGIKFLANGVPDAAGFTTGLYVGFKWF